MLPPCGGAPRSGEGALSTSTLCMTRSGILCGVAWCIDSNISIATWPPEETVATVLAQDDQGGCPGHNMSTALIKLGAPFPVSAIGIVGDDAQGKKLHDICDLHGIDRSLLEMRKGLSTSYVMAMTAQDTGKRTFFSVAGAHDVQTPDDFDFTKSNARYVHLGLPGFHKRLDSAWKDEANGWVALLKKARSAGLKTNLEMASFDATLIGNVVRPMLPHLDSLIINDFEAAAISGKRIIENGLTNIAVCREVLEDIITAHQNLDFAVVHFPLGAIAMTRGGGVYAQASVNVPRASIVGSNGAGDCFAAGILMGQHEGWSMQQSLKVGHASAAASLRASSTTAAVMKWEECLALADGWGWR
jgi:sugar/nucleoside kinase (ribokinase family)